MNNFREYPDDPVARNEMLLANIRKAARQMKRMAIFAVALLAFNVAVCLVNISFAMGWISR